MKKALKQTVASSAKSMSATTSPSRPGHAQKRSFHGTPTDAAHSSSSHTPQYGQYQHQQPSRPQAHQQPHESRMSFSSTSSGGARRGSAQSWDGMVFDEDVIEELRPIFAEKARRTGTGTGTSAGGAGMRAMDTGKGDEWVW